MSSKLQNPGTSDVAEMFRGGLRHYQEGRLEQAQEICQRILQQQHQPSAILIFGLISNQQKEFAVAV